MGRQKYKGWYLERISIDNDLFILDLARHQLRSSESIDAAQRRSMAKLIFTKAEKVVLSRVSCSAEITSVKKGEDGKGNIVYMVECSAGSFIEITARGVADLLF